MGSLALIWDTRWLSRCRGSGAQTDPYWPVMGHPVHDVCNEIDNFLSATYFEDAEVKEKIVIDLIWPWVVCDLILSAAKEVCFSRHDLGLLPKVGRTQVSPLSPSSKYHPNFKCQSIKRAVLFTDIGSLVLPTLLLTAHRAPSWPWHFICGRAA
jgi:hypothetical protein